MSSPLEIDPIYTCVGQTDAEISQRAIPCMPTHDRGPSNTLTRLERKAVVEAASTPGQRDAFDSWCDPLGHLRSHGHHTQNQTSSTPATAWAHDN